MSRSLKFKRYKLGDPFDPSTADRDTLHFVPELGAENPSKISVKVYDIDIFGNVAVIAGLPGPQGPPGEPGIDGATGADGTGIVIKGTKDDPSQLPNTNNNIGDAYIINGEVWVYDGVSTIPGATIGWVNVGKLQGDSSYIHFAYADLVEFVNGVVVNVEGFTLSDSAYKAWFGVYADNNFQDSIDVTKYQWINVEGPQGPPGEPGTSITIKGAVAIAAELPLTGNTIGDAYIVEETGHIHVWTEDLMWVDAGKFQGDNAYVHIAYADMIVFDGDGFPISQVGFTTDDTADKYWIGIYSDNIEADAGELEWKKYKWTKFPQGPKGDKGETGTGITIKGTVNSPDLLPSTGNTIGDAYLVQGDLWVYDGTSITVGATAGWYNAGKISGDNAYLHIAYADHIEFDADGVTPINAIGFSTANSRKNWMGVYTDNSPDDSTSYLAYKWTDIRGPVGPPGPAGSDGTAVTIKGSKASPDLLPDTGNVIGDGYIIDGDLWVFDNATNIPGATFGWNNVGKIQGDKAYFHIAYADSIGFDGDGNPISQTGFDVSNVRGVSKSWMGTYADNTEADSTDFRDYKWVYIRGPKGDIGDRGESTIYMSLINGNASVDADSDGNVTSYQGAVAEVHVYDGATELTYDNIGSVNGTYKVDVVATNITVGSRTTMALDKGVRFNAPSGMAQSTELATIKFTATIKTIDGRSIVLDQVQYIDKNKTGPAGEDAKGIKLTANSYVIKVSKSGSISPSTILIEAVVDNTTVESWQYSTDGGAFTSTKPVYIVETGAQTRTLNADSANFVTLSIKARSNTDNKQDIITITRLTDGIDGFSPTILTLTASSQVMETSASNVAEPNQSIDIIASLKNITGTPTFSAIPYNDAGTALAAITLDAGSHITRKILTNSKWLTTYKKVVITATLGSLTDVVTIHRLPEGADGETPVMGYLTNENATLPASTSGIVANYSNADGEFVVYYGQSKVTGGVVFSKVSNVNCTASINSSTGLYSVSNMSSSEDFASVKFRAVYSGVTIDRTLTLTKSKPGENGVSLPGAIVVQKEWVTGDTHRNGSDIIDFIYHRSSDTWYRLSSGYDNVVAAATPNSTQYSEIPWLKNLAVRNILVENANMGNLIFANQKLFSIRGTVNGVLSNYSGQANFIPNIYLNGLDGSGHFAGGNISWDEYSNLEISGKIAAGGLSTIGDKIKLNSDGSGQLADGNISWNEYGNVEVSGKITSASSGKRVVIDPATSSLKFEDAVGITRATMGFDDTDENNKHTYLSLNNVYATEVTHHALFKPGYQLLTSNYYLGAGAVATILSDCFNRVLQVTEDGRYGSSGYVKATASSNTGGFLEIKKVEASSGNITKTEVSPSKLKITDESSNTCELRVDGMYINGVKQGDGGGGGDGYTHPATHSASMITAGTFAGIVKAQNNNSYTTKQVRNMILSTGDAVASSMADGDIWIKYE